MKKKNWDQLINLILPNIDALKRSQSEHKLFLNQSAAQSLQVNTGHKCTL